jgi:lipopolysaccharide export system permease protein
MKILRNYILKDFFTVFIFSFLILSMVMLMGNLVQISDMIIRKGVNFFDAAKIFLFFTPYLLRYSIPLSFLMGILLAMGKLIADNEIIAMRVAGISLVRILNIFLILGAVFSLFLFILNDRVIPDFHYRQRTQIKNISIKNVSALIEPGVFLDSFQNYILYVSDKKENKLNNIFIYEIDDKKSTSKVTFARQGEFVVEGNTLTIKLEDGFRDETSSDDKNELYRLNFKVFFMDIPIAQKEKVQPAKKSSDMSIKELREKMAYLKKMGIDSLDEPRELKKEIYERISLSFSVISFVILGFGVSLAVKHREKAINFGIAFISAGVYYLLLILGETLIEYRLITPSLGMSLPNIVIISIGGYLFLKNAHFR